MKQDQDVPRDNSYRSFPSADFNPRRVFITINLFRHIFSSTRCNHSGNHLCILLIIIILTSTQNYHFVWGIIEIVHPLSNSFYGGKKKSCSMWQSDTISKRVPAQLDGRLPFKCRTQEWEWLHLNEHPTYVVILVGVCLTLPLRFQSETLKIGEFFWCLTDRPDQLVWTLHCALAVQAFPTIPFGGTRKSVSNYFNKMYYFLLIASVAFWVMK